MKKMTKIAFVLICLACTVCAFASADTLTACGVPQIVCDIFCAGGAGASFAIILPCGEQQTGLVVAYKNEELIADQVMPVQELEGKELTFKYFERTKGDAFTVPDTRVGRMSEPNMIHLSGVDKSDIVEPHGLEDPIPFEDINQIQNKERFVNTHFQYLINLVLLGREKRVADIVQNTSNYGDGLSHTYDANQGMGASGFNIVDTILEWLDKPLARPNKIGMNYTVYTKLRTDPNVIKAIFHNDSGSGIATKQQLCDLFEVKNIIVGAARVNTTKNAKNLNLERCWGNHIWAHYEEKLSTLTEGLAWGMTAQVGPRYADIIEDKKMGLQGGEILKAGFYQKEVVLGKDAGFLLKNVIKTA